MIRRRHGFAATLAALGLATAFAAAAQTNAGDAGQPARAGPSPQPVPSGPPTPAAPPLEPAAEAAAFAPRSALQCGDFQPAPGASWRALASISLPGPQGPVRITAGQIVSPGAYVSGLDVAAILQARCF